MDARGELVWASTDRFFDTTTNVNVQTYNNTPYLTFWAGNKHGGEGSGAAYMLNSNYEVYEKVRAVGDGLRTDLHEFSITPDGNALFSTINDTRADTSGMAWFRGTNGPIEDSVLQEVDIATGELVFQWRASDLFEPRDSFYINKWFEILNRYDFFHLNSAQKDSSGNYLISARHYSQILYVDGKTGETIWTLGGKNAFGNDFTDLSDGRATEFAFQHHARWQSQDEGIITVMDNSAFSSAARPVKPTSSALMLKIDQENRTVELLHSYTIDRLVDSQCSVQVLPSENVFVGWGPVAAFTEHDIAGDMLCEYQFAASWWLSQHWVKNYRTFKVYNWHSTPEYPPIAKTKEGKVYVSWNGATEVRFWRLEGADDPAANGEYHEIATSEKDAFETSFDIPSDRDYAYLRIAGLDADKNVLGTSHPAEEAEEEGSTTGLVFGILCAVGVALGGVIVYRLWARRRRQKNQQIGWELPDRRQYKYTPLDGEEDA